MICNTLPGLSVCDPSNQTTASGQLFFNVERVLVEEPQDDGNSTTTTSLPPLVNMPQGYVVDVTAAIQNMGIHCVDDSMIPTNPDEWHEPSVVYVSYGSVICFEPMIPLHFVTGTTNTSFSKDLEYVEQTMTTMPFNVAVEYNADTKKTKVTFQGTSNVCQADFEKSKAAYEAAATSSVSTSDAAAKPVWYSMAMLWIGLLVGHRFAS